MTEVLCETRYRARVDALYAAFKPRMIATLEALRGALEAAGYETQGPFDLTADDYQWYIVAKGNGLPEPVDLTLEIAESLSYGDGTEGVNFGLNIVAEGGWILGGITPFNYTAACWVDVRDRRALCERLRLIETLPVSGTVELLDDWKGS